MNNVLKVSAVQNPEVIAIDWEIHQLIELERRSFDESPLLALRRLLALDKDSEDAGNAKPRIKVKAMPAVWSQNGVTIPNGTKARFSYRRDGKPIIGEFKNGRLYAAGKEYDSLSEAANDLALTRNGKKTKLNGWLYWSIQMPEGSGNWVVLDTLRGK